MLAFEVIFITLQHYSTALLSIFITLCISSWWLFYDLLQVCTLKQRQSFFSILSSVTAISLLFPPPIHTQVCLFYIAHVSDIIQYMSFSVWLVTFNIMCREFIHVFTSGRIISLFCGGILFHCVYIPHLFFFCSIHPLMGKNILIEHLLHAVHSSSC